MCRPNAFQWVLAFGLLIGVGCAARQEAVRRQALDAAHVRGVQAAEGDIGQGILKQKEYPALPYSRAQMKFIGLLKTECGVVGEVVPGPGDSQEIRAEVAGYNATMQTEIERRFGAGIFQKLRQKADES